MTRDLLATGKRAIPNDTSGPQHAAHVGAVLALTLATPGVIACAFFVVRVPLSPLSLLMAFVLVGVWIWRSNRSHRISTLAAVALVWTVSLLVAAQFFDLTFDGQTYHQSAIRALARGWNPVWNPRAVEHVPRGMHAFALPKAAWILEALIYRTTGSLESAKGVHVIALAAAFLLAWPALEQIGARRKVALFGAALVTANPIALSQVISFHLDGLVSSSIIMLMAMAILYWTTGDRRWLVPFVLVAAFMANLKFPATLYVGFISLGVLGVIVMYDRRRLSTGLAVVTAIGGVAALEGINPYLTNYLLHGHPAYPARGPDAVRDYVHREPAFMAQSQVVQFVRSVISQSSDDDYRAPRAKIPLSLHFTELGAFTTVDTRIGGWGPLFSGALLLATVLLALAWRARIEHARTLAAFSACIVLSALLIPYGYYSRYTPQLVLACVPPVLMRNVQWRSSRLLAVILCCNTAIVGGMSLGSQFLNEHLHRAQLAALVRDGHGTGIVYGQFEDPFVNVDLHFEAYGIQNRAVDSLACAKPARLLRTHAMMCFADGRSPAPAPDPLNVIAPLLSAIGKR